MVGVCIWICLVLTFWRSCTLGRFSSFIIGLMGASGLCILISPWMFGGDGVHINVFPFMISVYSVCAFIKEVADNALVFLCVVFVYQTEVIFVNKFLNLVMVNGKWGDNDRVTFVCFNDCGIVFS